MKEMKGNIGKCTLKTLLPVTCIFILLLIHSKIPQKPCVSNHFQHDITLVTMYINLGKFQKAGGGATFTTNTYLKWMKSWAKLNNTVIAYFDDPTIMDAFKKIRSEQPTERTKVILIDRSELIAFDDLRKTKDVFAQPNYPKWYPNTVMAEYSCAMAAKYDALSFVIASQSNLTAKYIAWLDIGYFRNPDSKFYKLEVPEGFDDNTVGFTEVRESKSPLKNTPQELVKKNVVWVAGGFFLATPKVMARYVGDFRTARQEMLAKRVMSTDQQVIAALYSHQLRAQPSVNVSTYTCADGDFGLHGGDAGYMCLGYKCKKEAETRANLQQLAAVFSYFFW